MKYKIGMICYPSLGGSGVVATELGHQLAQRGHEVHFLSYEQPFRLNLSQKGIYFHEVRIEKYDLFKYPDYALSLAVKMAHIAKEKKLDILHVHYAIPHATSAFLAKQILNASSPRIITTLHGTDITLVGQAPTFFDMVKFSIEQSDVVTSVSHSLRQDTLSHFGIKKPIEVIHNFFVPRSPGDIQACRARFAKSDEKLIIHDSNFRPVKRVDDVIAIFERIRAALPAKLLLVGEGQDVEEVKRTVEKRGLSQDVFFVGKQRNVDPYVACGDLFLLPSEQESFGLAALEALAYGVPVIASNVGGLPEVVQHGETGFLAPVGDVEAMARYAIDLLLNKNLTNSFSRRARQIASESFSAEKIVPQYELLYKKALDNV